MIKDLENLALHDMPVKSLSIYFEEKNILIVIWKHNDEINDYSEITISFTGVKNLHLDDLPNLYVEEITDCNIEQKDSEYFVDFTMLYGHPIIPVNLSFSFDEVHVN